MLASGTVLDPQNLVPISKLMQNYKAEVPVSIDGPIVMTVDAQGQVVLFTISSADNVLCLRPDPGSDTGWRQTATGLVATQVAAGLAGDGTLLLAAPGPGSAITIVQETADGWSAPFTVTPPTNDNPSPIVEVAAQNVGGTLYIAYFLAYDPAVQGPPPPYVGWIGTWNAASNTIVDAFVTGGLDPCFLVPGTDAAGQASYFTTWTPQIYPRLTTQYASSNVYWDKGSGTPMNLAIWRPDPSPSYSSVGDLALGGQSYEYTPPTGAALTISRVPDYTGTIPDPIYLPQPSDFQLVWSDQHSGADEDGAVWTPVHPGYVPLGQVATRGYVASADTLPPLYAMVRQDLAVPGTVFEQAPDCQSSPPETCNELLIYANWHGHSGVKPVAIDAVQADATGVAAGTFYAHADWNVPTGQAWCLAANPVLNSLVVRFDPAQDYEDGCSAVGVPSPSRVVLPATAVDASGTARFFAILEDGQLYFLDQSQGAWVCLDPARTYAALAPTRDAKGHLEVFAIGTDRALYHVRQDAAAGGWGRMVPLETRNQYAQVVAGRNGAGHSMAFAVSATGGLWRLFQDPATTTWTVAEIELPDLGTVQEIRTYTTEISVSDVDLVPQPNYPVTIWSDDLVSASVNGEVFLLDGTPRVSCNTDHSGKLTVTVETTELTAPVLYVRTAVMLPGESLSIEPNAAIQDALRTVDADTLTDKLGVDPSEAPHAAQSIRAAMSLTQKSAPAGAHAFKYLRRARDQRGLRCRASGAEPSPARIDLAAVPDQAWRIDLKDGVRFTTLSAAEAEAIMDRERASFAGPEGFLDWLADLGDLVQAVVDGVADVVSYTVSKVVDGIEAGVTFIVDGVTYAFGVVVDLVEQAFDIVTTVFEAIGVAFENLVQWLGFLFDWPDIVRTKDALAHAVVQTLPLVKAGVAAIRDRADERIATLKADLQHSVQDVLGKVLGRDNSPVSFNAKHGTPPPQLDAAAGTNIVLTGFAANADAAPKLTRASPAAGVAGEVTEFWTVLRRHAGPDGAFQTSEGFSNALAYLERIGDSPDQFLQLLFASLLSALEGVAEAALDLAQAVVDAFCAAIEALVDWLYGLLTEPWHIPFVSALYKSYISPGSDLTALDLFCLIAAIPTTIVYKIANNAAPFADQAALDQFKGYYTTAWLLQISGAGGGPLGVSEPPAGWRDLLRWLFGLGLGASYAAYCVVEYNLDSYPPLAEPPPGEAWGIAALALEFSIWVFSLPWASPENDSGLGCKDGDTIGNTIWLAIGALPWLVDGACFLAQQRVARNLNDPGIAVDFVVNLTVMAGSIVALCKHSTKGWVYGMNTFATVMSTIKFIRFTPVTTVICGPEPPCALAVAKAAATADLFGDLVASVMVVVATIYIEDETGLRQRPTPVLTPV